ncbi:MAG: hypothetical protein ACO1RX_10430 [Candidatus Sericytochromatia bacterium]
MAGIRDMIRRALGGRPPEEALIEFKEKLHAQINDFKDNPESRAQLQRMLQSVLRPLQYFNTFVVRPHLADNERLRHLAQQYNVNKVELKRVLKVSLELEEKIQTYFKDREQVEQLVVTLRKVVNVLDEQVITDIINAVDDNVDYSKIERAYLDYQSTLQKAYNADGLNRDLQGIVGGVLNGLKNAFGNAPQRVRTRPSDQQPEARMLEPELQSLYDRYREEGFEHAEAMRFVTEKRELDSLPPQFLEAYQTLRKEGQAHDEALAYARTLANKAQDKGSDASAPGAEETP